MEQKQEAVEYLKSLDEDVLVEVLATMQNIQQRKEEKKKNPLIDLEDEGKDKYIQEVYEKIREFCQHNDGNMDLHEYRDEIVPELPRPAQDAILDELEKQNKITFEAYEDIDPQAIKKHGEELESGIEYEINDDFTYVQLIDYDAEEEGESEAEEIIEVEELEEMGDRVQVEKYTENPNRCAKVYAAFTNKKTAASWGKWLIKNEWAGEYEVKESENFNDYKWELELTETLIDGARLLAKNDLSKPPKRK